jgi:hypothetical protein
MNRSPQSWAVYADTLLGERFNADRLAELLKEAIADLLEMTADRDAEKRLRDHATILLGQQPAKVVVEQVALRDYFAAHASEPDLTAASVHLPRGPSVNFESNGYAQKGPGMLPRNARQLARYIHADMMLAARGETKA